MQRIMVVEDREDFRELYCDVLKGQGYEVVEAGNEAEAIELGFEGIDLVSTDIRMPHTENGYRLIQHLLDNHPELPVVVLSDSFGSAPDLTEDEVKEKYVNVKSTSGKASGTREIVLTIKQILSSKEGKS